MADPRASITLNERLANEQRVMFSKRAIKFSLIAVALSVVSFAIGMWSHPFDWTGALYGLIVLGTGVQLSIQHRQIARLVPEQARPWMPRVAYLLYLVGSLLLGAGILAGIRRFTA